MITRRRFVTAAGIGAAGVATGSWLAARGREDSIFSFLSGGAPVARPEAADVAPIILSSNENPLGPGRDVLDAVRRAFGPGGATPGRYSGASAELVEALATHHGVKASNIALGCGSTQVLRTATHVFTAPDRPLVTTNPAFEACTRYAEAIGRPVRTVDLTGDFRVDLDRFADAARGAGMVFFCNPNNPVATYVGATATREYLARVRRVSPETVVLIDEAYFHYVTEADHATHIPQAVDDPRVVVARTFSKAYGMAGIRIGYAVGHPDAINRMNAWDRPSGFDSLNVLAMHAASAAIGQSDDVLRAERDRNAAVRDFITRWFTARGMTPTASQANFMFVDIGRPAREFREACQARGVRVARDFPPFENSHCRISFGTMDEMQKAVQVFGEVLGNADASAA